MATATVTDRFTAVPKTRDLIGAGVPAAAIPTYNALADHANNKTGECWPMMETLALSLLDRQRIELHYPSGPL